MAGSFIDRTNPTFDDLGRQEVINVRCKCGREVQIAPYQLIGQHGVQKHTTVWSLRDRVPLHEMQAPADTPVLGRQVVRLTAGELNVTMTAALGRGPMSKHYVVVLAP